VAQALSGKNQIKTTNATIEPEFQTPQDEENSTLLEKGCHSIDEGDFKTAIKVFQRLIAAHPRWAEVHFNLGRAYQAQGRLVQAIQAYHAAIRLAPQLEEAHINLGLAYHQDGQLDKAAESYRQTIALHSNLALVFNNIGVLQEQQNDLSAAESSYQCALRIDPNNGDAHYNLGNIHLSHSRLDQAIVSYQNTLASNPQHVKALCNLGLTFHRKGLLDEALAHYNQALKFKPDYAEAHFNRAITLLLVGDWETGWQDYEWRFSCHDWKRTYPHRLYGDRWDGAAFKNKTLLVHSEQGIGDALHFARYLPLVKQRGGRVIFEARKSLLPLFDSLDCIDELIELSEDKAPGRHYHWHVPLCSLGYIFESTPSNLPNKVPYLKADPDKVAQWRKRLPLEGLNVGLVWGGNDTYKERSCTLEQMTPLAFVKGINWIGLQKGPAAAQASRDLLPRNFSLTNWGEEFIDFSDTAAAVDCLDLIISIDTSVAHLAGAMGKPVWILLPIVPDWRWMLERSQTPWYPTMHLFRQSKARGWPYVVAHLSSALERWRKRHAR
jgi:Flp pilus assembly protein TadD